LETRHFIVSILLLLGMTARGAEGIVQTSDGQTLQGDIRLESGKVVVLNTNKTETKVELPKLKHLRFLASTSGASSTGLVEVAQGTNLTNQAQLSTTNMSAAKTKLVAAVFLTGGSIIARRISSADDTSVRFFDSTNEIAISTINVARILFQPMPAGLDERIPGAHSGLLLSSKEFVEGDFKSFAQGRIKMGSVLFGIKSYDPGQVIAVILRELKTTPAKFELRTVDESRFLVNALALAEGSVVLQDRALAGFRIPAADLVEIETQDVQPVPRPLTAPATAP